VEVQTTVVGGQHGALTVTAETAPAGRLLVFDPTDEYTPLGLNAQKVVSKRYALKDENGRIQVPEFSVVRMGRKPKLPARFQYPVIVKSLTQEASIGISQASVIEDETKLRERVQFIHESVKTDAIIEQYIEGRELYVAVLGNQRLQVFPTWEMKFTKMPEDQHRIATERVKWNSKYQKRMGISTGGADLPPEIEEKVARLGRRVYETLYMSGYARIDLRMDAKGDMYVLEANPNPQIARKEDFADAAERAGVDYPALLQRILSIGMRWEPERLG